MQYRLDKKDKQYYIKVCATCNEIFLCKGICENAERIFYEQSCKCPDHSSPEETEACGKVSWKYNPSYRHEYPQVKGK
jgi:sulfatase maturation enzyme AslB (radical SAM superfamily)